MVHPKAFLTPHLETPNDTKRGEALSGSSTIVQTFKPIGVAVADRSVPSQKTDLLTYLLTGLMIYPTKRILALRLPDNKFK